MRPRSRFSQVGLDRLVRLKWLERTSELVLAGNTIHEVKALLRSDLAGSFRSTDVNVRGSADKTTTILMRVWVTVPTDLESLRTAGLELLGSVRPTEQVAIHWGMVMAAYPFWSSVSDQVGRLLRLQGSVASTSVQRRLREQYGERETVFRRTRYVLRSYVDWGVLEETREKGVYVAGKLHVIDDPKLVAWIAEAFLRAREGGIAPLDGLMDSPSLFPFQLKPVVVDRLLSMSTSLDVLRHGLGDDLIMLRKLPAK